MIFWTVWMVLLVLTVGLEGLRWLSGGLKMVLYCLCTLLDGSIVVLEVLQVLRFGRIQSDSGFRDFFNKFSSGFWMNELLVVSYGFLQ